jgi:hypothetical protein
MHVASVAINWLITTEGPLSYRFRYTTYQKQGEFVSLLTNIRNIKSVTALLKVRQSLVVIVYSYQVFIFSIFYRTQSTSDFDMQFRNEHILN